uniref:C2H2-type domain-containing protein n=1 Tax=Panagrolaimus superbus TaxID=310955 RepID=A0A914YUZ5_9BILA
MGYALNSGTDINDVNGMMAAITSGTIPLQGLTVVTGEIQYVPVNKKAVIPQITNLHDFSYDEKNPRVWRHFNIGPGRELDSKSFEDALIFPRLKITATWEHSPDDSGYIFWMKTSNTASLGDIATKDGPAVEEENEEENEEVDPEEPGPYDPQLLWSCLSPGCEKQYMHKGDRDNHMIEGNHQLAPEQYSLEEYTFKVYKNILEGPHHARIANRKSLETDESTTDTQPKEGWALKAPKKGNRYTTDMRAFLDAELDLYRNNGNVKEIERKMAEVKSSDGRKRFVPEQRLTAQQIAAYYKRKKEKIQKRKGKGKQFTSEEEEAESDQIVREMNDETGEIEIEHEDDPMILSAEDEIRSCIEVQDKTQDESEQNIANLYEDEQELSMLFEQPPKKAANCPKKRKSKKNAKRS